MSERTRFRAWITKHVLTTGIENFEVEDCFNISDRTVVRTLSVEQGRLGRPLEGYHKPDWHRTKEEAVARAEEMRRARLEFLRKSIGRLEKLTFVL